MEIDRLIQHELSTQLLFGIRNVDAPLKIVPFQAAEVALFGYRVTVAIHLVSVLVGLRLAQNDTVAVDDNTVWRLGDS